MLTADTMDQVKREASETLPVPSKGCVVVNLKPLWSLKEEPADPPTAVFSPGQPLCPQKVKEDPNDPPAVYSRGQPQSLKKEPAESPSPAYAPGQPLSDNTCGSLLSVIIRPVCQRCSAAFVLVSSLELHLALCHGEPGPGPGVECRELPGVECWELPGSSALQGMGKKITDQKQESPWSLKEEPADLFSAVFSPGQPLSDNMCDSLLSVSKHHVCECCLAAFVLISSLELHMVCFHGEKLHTVLPVSSTSHECDSGHHGSRIVGNVLDLGDGNAEERSQDQVDSGIAVRREETENGQRHVCDIQNQTGDKPHVCTDWETFYLFYSKAALSDPHRDCGKRFAYYSNLKRHCVTHTGKKTHVCTDCGKCFAYYSNLKRHCLTHTGEKPHACTDCGKRFFFIPVIKSSIV